MNNRVGGYELEHSLGTDLLSERFLATRTEDGTNVSLRRFHTHLMGDTTAQAAFIVLVMRCARLNHPRIARTFGLVNTGEALYVTEEYVDGVPLSELLDAFAARERPVPPELAAWIVHAVVDTLDYAHVLGIAHGDLGPDKIYLTASGELKIVDFATKHALADTATVHDDLVAVGFLLGQLLTGASFDEARIRSALSPLQSPLADVARDAIAPVGLAWPTASMFRSAIEGCSGPMTLIQPALGDMVAELRRSTERFLADGSERSTFAQGSTQMKPVVIGALPLRPVTLGMLHPQRPVDKRRYTPAPGVARVRSRRVAIPPAPRPVSASTDEGQLDETPPLRLLFRIAIAHRTGRLLLTHDAIRKEVHFRDGQPQTVVSNIGSEDFGEFLVKRRVLSDGELSMVQSLLPKYGEDLGAAITDLGLLPPHEALAHFTDHTRAAIIDLCGWKRGRYTWSNCDLEVADMVLDAFEVIAAGALTLPASFVTAWLASRGEVRFAQTSAPRVDPERFGVDGLCEFWDSFCSARSASSIATMSDPDVRLRSLRWLHLLVCCELLVEAPA